MSISKSKNKKIWNREKNENGICSERDYSGKGFHIILNIKFG